MGAYPPRRCGISYTYSITELIIERLDFVVGAQNSHQGLIIDSAHDVYNQGLLLRGL